jgi:pantothenate kinase/RimJ/RimL family protein N-acetyltransferase
MPDVVDDPQQLLARARGLATAGGRRVLAVTGPPGSGKSTLAADLVAELAGLAVVVPMDGFHLAQCELRRLGRADRKGAPDTFDAAGYVALLRRLRHESGTVYAPAFRRDLEEPVAGAIAVEPDTPLVVTEGNYLLLDGPWAPVRTLCDDTWYVDLPAEERVRRLVARHAAHGKPHDAAHRWATGSDEANAAVVAATRARADVVVVPGALPPPRVDGPIGFRSLTRADLPDVQRWRSEPHVARWFEPLDDAAVAAKYLPRIEGRDPTRMYVVELAGRPVGFAQCYRHADLPGTDAAVGVPAAAGIDYCLGEPAVVGRGLGPRVIDAFVRDVVLPTFPDAVVVVGAPAADNERSIRALEKAGFQRSHRAVEPRDGHELVVCVRPRTG